MIRLDYRPKVAARLNALAREVEGRGSRILMDRVAEELTAGNREDRMREVDRRGSPLPRWRVRTGRYRGATGPTLAPFGESSGSVRNYAARGVRRRSGWEIVAGWTGPIARILGYHADGVRGVKRDIRGPSPRVMNRIRRLFADWASGVFKRRP